MTHVTKHSVDMDGCDKSIKWIRIRVDMNEYHHNKEDCVKRLLGNDVHIVSYRQQDIITDDDNLVIDVCYLKITDTLVAQNGCIKYVRRSDLQQTAPNQNKYVGRLCSITKRKPDVEHVTIKEYNAYDYADDGVTCIVSLNEQSEQSVNTNNVETFFSNDKASKSEYVCLRVLKIITNNNNSKTFDFKDKVAYIGKETNMVLNSYIAPIGILRRVGKYNMKRFDRQCEPLNLKLDDFEQTVIEKYIPMVESKFKDYEINVAQQMLNAVLESGYDNGVVVNDVKWRGVVDANDVEKYIEEDNGVNRSMSVFVCKDVDVLDAFVGVSGVIAISTKRSHPFVVCHIPLGVITLNKDMIDEAKNFVIMDAAEWVKYKLIVDEE